MARVSARHAAVLLLALVTVACGRSSPGDEHPEAASLSAPSSAAAPTPVRACILTPEALGKIVAPKFSGPVTISSDVSPDFDGGGVCTYHLAAYADFTIDARRYSDNLTFSIGSSDLDRTIGGSTPQQVFTSASTAYRDFAQDGPNIAGFAVYPDVGGGLATDAMGELVLAGTGDCWYHASFSGVAGSQPGKDIVVAAGKAMAVAAK